MSSISKKLLTKCFALIHHYITHKTVNSFTAGIHLGGISLKQEDSIHLKAKVKDELCNDAELCAASIEKERLSYHDIRFFHQMLCLVPNCTLRILVQSCISGRAEFGLKSVKMFRADFGPAYKTFV